MGGIIAGVVFVVAITIAVKCYFSYASKLRLWGENNRETELVTPTMTPEVSVHYFERENSQQDSNLDGNNAEESL